MGCDIHCIIEYKHKTINGDRWDSFGYTSFTPGRDYSWFANLAGVRGEPKGGVALASGFGIPEDASFTTRMESSYFVQDTNSVDIKSMLDSGTVKWIDWAKDLQGKPTRVTHPDWHTYGWCDVKAWKKSLRGKDNLYIKCMNAIIDTLAKNKCKVRVVFWFDN